MYIVLWYFFDHTLAELPKGSFSYAPGSARVRKVLVSRAPPFIGSAGVYPNGCGQGPIWPEKWEVPW